MSLLVWCLLVPCLVIVLFIVCVLRLKYPNLQSQYLQFMFYNCYHLDLQHSHTHLPNLPAIPKIK